MPRVAFTPLQCWRAAAGRYFSKAGVAPGIPFDALRVHEHSLRALREVFRYDAMTQVQERVLPHLLKDLVHPRDAIIRARTGTGKTLTYLIPAVEQTLARAPPGVNTLVIAPSRELVLQITRETEMLCTYHGLQVVPLIGGVRRDVDTSAIRRRRPAIIVGTPGKLLEHLESTFRFQTLFEALGSLVLDECDNLLADTEPMRDILGYLPKSEQRQSLLLSATIPKEVLDFAAMVCRPGYEVFDCVGSGVPTQESVEQSYIVSPGLLLLTALRNTILEEMNANPTKHKVMVFFPTARLAAFVARLFRDHLKMRVHELHARCDAAARILMEQEFRDCVSGMLFTSGVSERGMDYPDVSLVVQVLAPESREHYVHRVGRTARAGKAGRAVVLLLDHEVQAGALDCIMDLPVSRHPAEAQLLNDEGDMLAHATSSVRWSPNGGLLAAAAGAYTSLLKHYQVTQRVVNLGPDGAVLAAGEVLLGCGLAEPPPISERLAEELGLLHCSELRLKAADDRGGVVSPQPGSSSPRQVAERSARPPARGLNVS